MCVRDPGPRLRHVCLRLAAAVPPRHRGGDTLGSGADPCGIPRGRRDRRPGGHAARKVDDGRAAFEDLQQQAQAALRDLARHVEEGQTALTGTLTGVAALRRELDERHKEIADAALLIDRLRRRLADREDLSATTIRVCSYRTWRRPRLNRVVHKLLPRSKTAPASAVDS